MMGPVFGGAPTLPVLEAVSVSSDSECGATGLQPEAVAASKAAQANTPLACFGLHKRKRAARARFQYIVGGVDGTRTRDPRRDRPVF